MVNVITIDCGHASHDEDDDVEVGRHDVPDDGDHHRSHDSKYYSDALLASGVAICHSGSHSTVDCGALTGQTTGTVEGGDVPRTQSASTAARLDPLQPLVTLAASMKKESAPHDAPALMEVGLANRQGALHSPRHDDDDDDDDDVLLAAAACGSSNRKLPHPAASLQAHDSQHDDDDDDNDDDDDDVALAAAEQPQVSVAAMNDSHRDDGSSDSRKLLQASLQSLETAAATVVMVPTTTSQPHVRSDPELFRHYFLACTQQPQQTVAPAIANASSSSRATCLPMPFMRRSTPVGLVAVASSEDMVAGPPSASSAASCLPSSLMIHGDASLRQKQRLVAVPVLASDGGSIVWYPAAAAAAGDMGMTRNSQLRLRSENNAAETAASMAQRRMAKPAVRQHRDEAVNTFMEIPLSAGVVAESSWTADGNGATVFEKADEGKLQTEGRSNVGSHPPAPSNHNLLLSEGKDPLGCEEEARAATTAATKEASGSEEARYSATSMANGFSTSGLRCSDATQFHFIARLMKYIPFGPLIIFNFVLTAAASCQGRGQQRAGTILAVVLGYCITIFISFVKKIPQRLNLMESKTPILRLASSDYALVFRKDVLWHCLIAILSFTSLGFSTNSVRVVLAPGVDPVWILLLQYASLTISVVLTLFVFDDIPSISTVCFKEPDFNPLHFPASSSPIPNGPGSPYLSSTGRA